jgi:hypothetical protein
MMQTGMRFRAPRQRMRRKGSAGHFSEVGQQRHQEQARSVGGPAVEAEWRPGVGDLGPAGMAGPYGAGSNLGSAQTWA